MTLLDALTLIPSSIPFVLNALNESRWPRADALAEVDRTVSVLIPARNEAANIERAVRAALAVEPPVLEVVVCDDDSTDDTPRLLEALAAEDARVRVISAGPLPEGWVGKPHACHHLGLAARGELLLFVDADTALAPDATRRLAALMGRFRAKVVTAFPHQEAVTFLERLIVPMLPLTFTSWLPLDLIWKHVDPAFLVVNGQVLAFTRPAYDATGGFEAVRGEIVDDMAICRRAKEEDQRVVFVDGHALASARMYRSAAEVWSGFSKNFYEGLGERPAVLLFVVTVYLLAFVLPYGRLAVELATTASASWQALVGIGFNLGARALLARRLGHSLTSVLLHPLAVLLLLGIAINSALWVHSDRIAWRGRTYTRRASRTG